MKDIVKILELDKYEAGIIVNALHEFRSHLINEKIPTDAVDEIIVKTMDKNAEKKPTYKMLDER